MKKGEKEGRNNFFLTYVFTVVIAPFGVIFLALKIIFRYSYTYMGYGEGYVHLFIYGF